MKPEPIDLVDVADVRKLAARVVQVRLREARTLTEGLERRDKQRLHDFRIACKRLRYALERFQALEPTLETFAERLALLQDALGEAHDRDVLLGILPPTMAATERRLQREREQRIDQAIVYWREAEQMMRALDSHRI